MHLLSTNYLGQICQNSHRQRDFKSFLKKMHFQKKKKNLLIDFTTFLYINNIHERTKIINRSGILDPLNEKKVNSQ